MCVPLLLALVFVQPLAAAGDPPSRQGEVPLGSPEAPLACDPDGQQASGAVYRICMPSLLPWNGDLVVFAHGYVSPTEPVGIPEEQMTLPGGVSIADAVTLMGYGFATTSYSTNGLAIREGLVDLIDLVGLFATAKGEPGKVYLVGASEGGLIAALAVEQHPDVFDGGLAMCGPYGDFNYQVNYFGDVRIVFDYFFPALIPGSAVEIPASLMAGWDAYYAETVRPQIEDPANAGKVDQLLRVTGVPYDPSDSSAKEASIAKLLWYNVFATNDGVTKLGGQPFNNQERVYSGSDDDADLNQSVQRFAADQAALDAIATYYQTSGQLRAPLVTLHTTGDHVVPYWHATRYRAKTIAAGNNPWHEHLEADRYGHCSFTSGEVLGAFDRLGSMVERPHRVFLPLLPRAD
jgi:pimeloyl-ACP methyl ester carboxylesterase